MPLQGRRRTQLPGTQLGFSEVKDLSVGAAYGVRSNYSSWWREFAVSGKANMRVVHMARPVDPRAVLCRAVPCRAVPSPAVGEMPPAHVLTAHSISGRLCGSKWFADSQCASCVTRWVLWTISDYLCKGAGVYFF